MKCWHKWNPYIEMYNGGKFSIYKAMLYVKCKRCGKVIQHKNKMKDVEKFCKKNNIDWNRWC